MPKIAFIGAGSMVFSANVIADILSFDSLKSSELALMDVSPERLDVAGRMAVSISRTRGAEAKVSTHAELAPALDGADFVINTIGVGGFGATRTDLETPARRGLRQTIGDTLGIGGISRSLRSIPVVLDLAWEMESFCPGALLLNYTNPMATHCLALQRASSVESVGLCHGVRYTRARMAMLAALVDEQPDKAAEVLGAWTPDEPHGTAFHDYYSSFLNDDSIEALCAGINHMAAYLVFRRRDTGEDLYPRLSRALEDERLRRLDPVRLELMKRFGYFMTETSGHIAEYLPWFMKSPAEIERLRLEPNSYIRTCQALDESFLRYKRMADSGEDFIRPDRPRSIEYASFIINAAMVNEPFAFNGNVNNEGGALIANLPRDCCVEVPCYVDGLGIHPTAVGYLPAQCAAMMMTNINVQELIVQGILEEDRDSIYHAAYLDPNAAASLTMPEIESLMDEMVDAHGDLLPEFMRD